MKKRFQFTAQQFSLMALFIGVLLFLSFPIVTNNSFVTSSTVSAQETMSGDWTAEIDDKVPDKLQLNFYRRTAKGNNNHGSGYLFSEIQGLSRQQVAQNASVKFQLVREAGTIDCEGKFTNGKGTGTWRFTPNQSFISAMQTRGFKLSEEKLFTAAALNLTAAFVDDLKSMGFENLDTEDLFKAVIFKITPQFAQEMKATGFANLDMEDLVKARIFKIDANFVRQVMAMGFDKEPFESLVKMRIFKITPEFLSEVQAEGFKNLDIEDYVKMKIFKIDAAFIRRSKSENPNVTIEDMVQMRIGVKDR